MSLPIRFDASLLRDLSRASSREWLETNGLGGWSSSTLAGAHTRRYHGLLVVANQPPVGRLVLLSKLEETLVLPHDHVELGCSLFPGAVHPEGYGLLSGFSLDPFPSFTYATDEIRLRKTIGMVHGEHTVVVLYELLRAPGPVQLELRPFFAGRDYHHLMKANDAVEREGRFKKDVFRYRSYPDQPTVHLSVPGAHYNPSPSWYYNYQYPREEERGLEYSEDLFTPGALHCTLKAGGRLAVLIAVDDPRGRDGSSLLEAERQRRASLSLPGAPAQQPLADQLARAADQFLVRRGDGLHTILAGYHWFTDWGRDTMIALPGLCLVTGRHAEAKSIFRAFAAHISDGMIPNRFPDFGQQPEYNTVDATLWFFVALHKYLQYTGDYGFVQEELWEPLQEILAWHGRGTRFQIGVDPDDGLLAAGEEGAQLTWMDAKVDGWVVTPRQGKPVEINALWYNALRVTEQLAGRFSAAALERELRDQAEGVKEAFARLFWNASEKCLFDVIDGRRRDPAMRPNQIFALSLPFPLLDGEQARQVFAAVDRHLFTPCGLRSLSPADPAYRSRYLGTPWERDGAYHQGIVWGWLIGPFITALVRLHGEAGRARARRIVADFEDHLGEAGLGSVSEIFDAEGHFAPRGCVAQAWSVAELLRAYCEDVEGGGPERGG